MLEKRVRSGKSLGEMIGHCVEGMSCRWMEVYVSGSWGTKEELMKEDNCRRVGEEVEEEWGDENHTLSSSTCGRGLAISKAWFVPILTRNVERDHKKVHTSTNKWN
eukprot:Phypoly_transcript_22337.p1 GENE.Phypoly_transcript_22337~~Phypoly_transcript_22337.p1  ORF type:complete len:106 (+),score=14.77 Phypoly_transcript_22337:88-405(+)